MSSVLSWLVLSNSSCGGHREEWARHQAAGQEVICTHRYTSANAQTGRTRKKLVTDVLLQEVLKGESGIITSAEPLPIFALSRNKLV